MRYIEPLNIKANTGKKTAAANEATETILNMKNTIIHKIAETSSAFGARTIKTPALVATPLPPLNPRNTLQTCPIMAKAPRSIL